MKKIQYIAPSLRITKLGLENMIAGSITGTSIEGLGTGGNSSDAGISAGNTKADQANYNVWDDDWSK